MPTRGLTLTTLTLLLNAARYDAIFQNTQGPLVSYPKMDGHQFDLKHKTDLPNHVGCVFDWQPFESALHAYALQFNEPFTNLSLLSAPETKAELSDQVQSLIVRYATSPALSIGYCNASDSEGRWNTNRVGPYETLGGQQQIWTYWQDAWKLSRETKVYVTAGEATGVKSPIRPCTTIILIFLQPKVCLYGVTFFSTASSMAFAPSRTTFTPCNSTVIGSAVPLKTRCPFGVTIIAARQKR